MKRLVMIVAITGSAVGCAPDYLRPTIPLFPPDKPIANAAAEASRPRVPVTPAQITDQNATQKLNELEAEMEADARK